MRSNMTDARGHMRVPSCNCNLQTEWEDSTEESVCACVLRACLLPVRRPSRLATQHQMQDFDVDTSNRPSQHHSASQAHNR